MSEENHKLPQEKIDEAIQSEKTHFETFYLWLEKAMPRLFFKEVDDEWISLIVHALMGFKVQDYFAEIHLKQAAISLCIDSAQADVSILKSYPMYGIKNYTTYISRIPLPFPEIEGKKLRIATINFTDAIDEGQMPLEEEDLTKLTHFLQARNLEWSPEKIKELIDIVYPPFLKKMPMPRQAAAIEMLERAQTRDHCQYEVQYEEDWEKKEAPSMHIVLTWKNVPKHNFLYRLARVVFQHGLVMRRVNATYVNPYTIDSIFMLSFGLHGAQGEAAWEASDVADFLQELVTLKSFGSMDKIDEVFVKEGLIRGNLGNLLRTMVKFIHQVLVHVDPNLYNLENIEEGLCRHPELTVELCKAFEDKLHPSRYNLQAFESGKEEFIQLVSKLDTGHEYHDNRRRNILLQGMNFVSHILKTNFYKNNKTAFAFRLDPRYLDHAPFEREKKFPDLPYGIFFIKGMHFLSFHIRFKDLSRGGLRTIYPEKKELVVAEQNTVFSECYNLAYTQHKKNKDIPEGGSKCVIFLKPYERLTSETQILERELEVAGISPEEIKERITLFQKEQKLEYLYQTQRAFIKNLLTLVNTNNDGSLKAKHVLDYFGRPEYIYLGPDENMHNVMIEWIAHESVKVGYKPGGAFISGKPEVGINHKEYGVTSMGVNVYMDEMLRYLGIDPLHDSFTVKMTGGPDGDVAGNQILNLYNHYRETAKLIALTDVSGTIHDPEGLDLSVCKTLFEEGKSIRFYPPEKLSVGGFLLDRTNRKEPTPYMQQTLCWKNKGGKIEAEWISGNEMNALFRHNVHKTPADIFIPCGGRPRTLRDTNYKDFLDDTGKPTAKAIIEGANLYLSPWARHYLEELGVLIIKDSSANKGGVISSSFEILCGLTLSDELFIKHKGVLVDEILEKLKGCAQNEAKLLLSSHKEHTQPLSELSDEISKRINHFTDQLLTYLETLELTDNAKDPLIECFLHYCPKHLETHFKQKLLTEVPESHKKAVIASHIAARLVYSKGLKWFPSLVDILPLILQEKELFD